ncbi:hypothetical protein B9T07_14485 [Limnospira fusiformis CCALA 023]|uniref:hypothetical protein n=1 Tax=Oscillatoriales TaxID=1150 RepID=UPI00396EC7DA
MTSTICYPTNSPVESTNSWLYLIADEVAHFTGDDWLALCPDIDDGELYRDWFIWYDADVNGLWEAYDHLTDEQIISPDLEWIKSQIDAIENLRKLSYIQIA